MIKQITKEDIKELLNAVQETCVSIFMPVLKGGSQVRQNRIRFKNLIANAIGQLSTAGVSLQDPKNLLIPAKQILNDNSFWEAQSQSFVAYQSNRFFASYSLDFPVEEEVVVGKHFYIKPLLPLLLEDSDFYLMALSKKQIRLFSCDSFNYQEIRVTSIPKNFQEASRFNDPERVLQLHTNTPRTPGSRGAAIFHGHGVGIDDEKDDLLEYFRQIDRGLHPVLKDKKIPLVLAAVDYFHPLYKKMNTYPYVFEEGISGNTDFLADGELYQKGKDIIKPYLEKRKQEAIARFDDFEGTDRVSKNMQTIIEAARAGRVWNLFLQSGVDWWGKLNFETGELISHDLAEPGDEEISNLAAIYTIQNRGNVMLIDKNPSRPAAFAILRY
jgi:hypothetical protein